LLISDVFIVDGNGILGCPPSIGRGTFCCYGYNGCNCTNSTQVFSLGIGTVLTTLAFTTPSRTAGSSSSTSIPQNVPTASTASGIVSDGTRPNGAAIGAGVGVGIPAMVAIMGLLYWIWRLRSKIAPNSISAEKTYTRHEMDASTFSVVFRVQCSELESPGQNIEKPSTNRLCISEGASDEGSLHDVPDASANGGLGQGVNGEV
jgi:hypothetical protein